MTIGGSSGNVRDGQCRVCGIAVREREMRGIDCSWHAYPVRWYESRALDRQLPFHADGYVSAPWAAS